MCSLWEKMHFQWLVCTQCVCMYACLYYLPSSATAAGIVLWLRDVCYNMWWELQLRGHSARGETQRAELVHQESLDAFLRYSRSALLTAPLSHLQPSSQPFSKPSSSCPLQLHVFRADWVAGLLFRPTALTEWSLDQPITEAVQSFDSNRCSYWSLEDADGSILFFLIKIIE